MTKRKTKEDFVQEANIVHNFKYNYNNVQYINNKIKVEIHCLNNHIFEQTPYAHVGLKQGCPFCKGVNKATTAAFILKAVKIHKGLYDYSSTIYNGARNKVKIICKTHGMFEQTARNHVNSAQGCPTCGKEINGWTRTNYTNLCKKNNNGYGVFYILKCFNDNEEFYKIGITSKSISDRYRRKDSMPYNYSVIQEVLLEAEYAYNLEKIYMKQLETFRYTPHIFFDGFTECFKIGC